MVDWIGSIKKYRIMEILIIIAIVVVSIYAVYKLSYYVAPFIIAFIISSLLEPPVRLIVKKTKIPRKLAAPIVLLLFLLCFGSLLTLLILKLINEIKDMSKMLPVLFTTLFDNTSKLFDKVIEIYEWLPEEVAINVESFLLNQAGSLMNTVNSVINSLLKGAYATAVSIPEALVFVLITILATYFLTSDRERISRFFYRQFPENWIEKALNLRNNMFSALFGWIKAYLILMLITFAELFIGFIIIRMNYPLLLALIISIVDLLPVLGSGTILIPWSIYSFLVGNIKGGISLIVLYAIVFVVRQMIEPKIVSHQIGVYPLLTLIAMYAGLKLVGVIGLILGPVTILLVKNILSGILKNRPLKEVLNKTKP